MRQGCHVGLFEAKFAKFGLFLDGCPRNFVEVIKYSDFFKSLGLFIGWPFFSKSSKIQNLAFFKTEFGLFQLQAAGNPGMQQQGTRRPAAGPRHGMEGMGLGFSSIQFFISFHTRQYNLC